MILVASVLTASKNNRYKNNFISFSQDRHNFMSQTGAEKYHYHFNIFLRIPDTNYRNFISSAER